MKKLFWTIFLCLAATTATAQNDTLPRDPDTARAAQIIDRYLEYVDFSKISTDSMICVVTKIVSRSHPGDTSMIYRWYAKPMYSRIEMYQDGKMTNGLYGDGTGTFKMFMQGPRTWATITQDSYFDLMMSRDIRGALYNWRSRGAEVSFAGEYDYEGHKVNRVFVTCPRIFDRYYFFEQESGLLFMATEIEHIYGDGKITRNAQKVDWRAWNEFVPFRGCMMPSIESYQAYEDITFLYHSYHMEPLNKKLFTEDFHQIP